MHGTSSNVAFFDGHSKSFQNKAMEPFGLTTNGSHWECANCDKVQYEPVGVGGTLWTFWGTSYGAANFQ
jgi:prepilin-type processing-associated H-X9-DG protein